MVDQARLLSAARKLVVLNDDPHPGLPTWHEERGRAVDEIREALAVKGSKRRVVVEVLVEDANHCSEECAHLEKTKAWCRLFSRNLGVGERLLRDTECRWGDVTEKR